MKNHYIMFSYLLLIATFLFCEFTSIDLVIQNWFYNNATQHWLVDRHNPVLRFIFYDGIKILLISVYLVVLIFYSFFKRHRIRSAYKKGLQIFLLSGFLVPLTIGTLKAVTHIPCPRQLMLFNGTFPYTKLLGTYPTSFKPAKKCKCYPAGHASGGFALLSLCFLFKTSRNRRFAMMFALFLGWAMGLYKMMIGDHFFSHTVMTMLLSWLIIQGIARLLLKERPSLSYNVLIHNDMKAHE